MATWIYRRGTLGLYISLKLSLFIYWHFGFCPHSSGRVVAGVRGKWLLASHHKLIITIFSALLSHMWWFHFSKLKCIRLLIIAKIIIIFSQESYLYLTSPFCWHQMCAFSFLNWYQLTVLFSVPYCIP